MAVGGISNPGVTQNLAVSGGPTPATLPAGFSALGFPPANPSEFPVTQNSLVQPTGLALGQLPGLPLPRPDNERPAVIHLDNVPNDISSTNMMPALGGVDTTISSSANLNGATRANSGIEDLQNRNAQYINSSGLALTGIGTFDEYSEEEEADEDRSKGPQSWEDFGDG